MYVYLDESSVNVTWGPVVCMLRYIYKSYLISPISLSRLTFRAEEVPVI